MDQFLVSLKGLFCLAPNFSTIQSQSPINLFIPRILVDSNSTLLVQFKNLQGPLTCQMIRNGSILQFSFLCPNSDRPQIVDTVVTSGSNQYTRNRYFEYTATTSIAKASSYSVHHTMDIHSIEFVPNVLGFETYKKQDPLGQNPLHHIVAYNSIKQLEEISSSLLNAYSFENDALMRTPIMVACAVSKLDTISVLLKRLFKKNQKSELKRNLSQQNDDFESALQFARINPNISFQDFSNLLLQEFEIHLGSDTPNSTSPSSAKQSPIPFSNSSTTIIHNRFSPNEIPKPLTENEIVQSKARIELLQIIANKQLLPNTDVLLQVREWFRQYPEVNLYEMEKYDEMKPETWCLIAAVYYENIPVMEYLLQDQKVDVNARYTDGWTALFRAIGLESNSAEIPLLLVKYGANIFAKTEVVYVVVDNIFNRVEGSKTIKEFCKDRKKMDLWKLMEKTYMESQLSEEFSKASLK